MIEHTYHNYTIEQRDGLHYVIALRQSFATEALAHAAIDRDIEVGEAIIRSNADQDRYYQSVGGRDESITGAVGWNERYELLLRELP